MFKGLLRGLAAFALSIVVLTAGHEILLAGGPYFHRVITQSIEFRQDESTLPAAGTAYVARDGSGELTLNVLTGQSINLAVNAVDIANLALAGFDMLGNSIDNSGFLILNTDTEPAGTEVYVNHDNSGDVSINALSGQQVIFQVAGTDEVTISATVFDFTTLNASNMGTLAVGAITTTGDLAMGGNDLGGLDQLQFTDATTLTPTAAGVITVTQVFHNVTAITGQTVDSIATVNGGVAGDIIIFTAADTDDIFFDVDGGNLRGTDRSVFEVGDMIMYLFDGSNWQELSFSDNN